jgi:hypothetical protein
MLYVVSSQDLETQQAATERVNVDCLTAKHGDFADRPHIELGLMRADTFKMFFSMGAKGVLDAPGPSLSQDKQKFTALAFPAAVQQRVGPVVLENEGEEREVECQGIDPPCKGGR